MRSFHSDSPKGVTKAKELEVHQLLGEAGLGFDYQLHIPLRQCEQDASGHRAYVDFVLNASWGKVLLEVDERQHEAHPSVALGSAHKLAIVRYNPDPFKVAGRTVRTPKKERRARLLQLLHSLLQEEPERQFQRLFLYYDRAAEDSELPAVAEDWDVVARTVSRAVV